MAIKKPVSPDISLGALLAKRAAIMARVARDQQELSEINKKLLDLAERYGMRDAKKHRSLRYENFLVRKQRRVSLSLNEQELLKALRSMGKDDRELLEAGVLTGAVDVDVDIYDMLVDKFSDQLNFTISAQGLKKAVDEGWISQEDAKKYIVEKESFALVVKEIEEEKEED